MQNRQNHDPNVDLYHCNSFVLSSDQDFQALNQHSTANPLENDLNSESPRKGNIVFDRLDLLAMDSLCTISRGSLDIPNDQPSMDVNTNIEEEIPSTFKSSKKDFIFQQKENSEEMQRKLVIETEELTLKSSDYELIEDIFDDYTPKKHRRLIKEDRGRNRHIKHAKQLIKELKREHKYCDKIRADVVVSKNNKICKINSAHIEPIISDKGHLSGLIVKNQHDQFKIKVVNLKNDTFDPQLQLWDQTEETWTEFEFKIKIRNA